MTNKKKISADCKDVWNAFMVRGANFSRSGIGIPFCPTTSKEIPRGLISYTEARAIYNRRMKRRNSLRNMVSTLESRRIFRHFAGIITPDFSTYLDFPFPLKIFNTYRMRAFGYWYGTLGGAVINNVRRDAADTFSWCFESIPQNSFAKLLEVLKPHTIIVYGSYKYPCFDSIRQEIKLVTFQSEHALAFAEKNHV